MIRVACYNGGKLIMTSLIIIKIKFVCFQKDEVDKSHVSSHTRSHTKSHDYSSCDYGVTIVFFFGMSSDKQIIV